MSKGEISWVREAEPEGKLQVYAHRVGNQWNFFARQKRFDEWAAVPHPPLQDWLELLDGIRRRVARRLVRPEEIQRVEKVIRERFPEAEI